MRPSRLTWPRTGIVGRPVPKFTTFDADPPLVEAPLPVVPQQVCNVVNGLSTTQLLILAAAAIFFIIYWTRR